MTKLTSSFNPHLLFQFGPGLTNHQVLEFIDPVEVIVAWSVEEVLPALEAVQSGVESGLYAAGYVSYDAAPAFDAAFRVPGQTTVPLAWFGLFLRPVGP